MSRAARVTSIDVLPLLAAAMQKFRGQAVAVLDDLDIETRRILEWIHHDRKEYWERELHRVQEKLNQARLQLQQGRMSRRVGDHEAACLEEKRAVAVAQRRIEIARQKIEAVRHWTRVIERAVDDFLRSRSRFGAWVDIDFPKATAVLDAMSEALVTYIALEAGAPHAEANPEVAPPPADGAAGTIMPAESVPGAAPLVAEMTIKPPPNVPPERPHEELGPGLAGRKARIRRRKRCGPPPTPSISNGPTPLAAIFTRGTWPRSIPTSGLCSTPSGS